jgi:hypothetical protein
LKIISLEKKQALALDLILKLEIEKLLEQVKYILHQVQEIIELNLL